MTKARLPPLAMSSGTNCYSLGVLLVYVYRFSYRCEYL